MNIIMNVPAINGVMPHCESILPNHGCPYIKHGCTGCRMVASQVKMIMNGEDITALLSNLPKIKNP